MAVVSIRKAIVAAIIAHLKTITIANGYNTEIGNSVKDWSLSNIPIADLPCLEVNDPSEDTVRKGQKNYNTLIITITGRTITDDIDTARDLLADITLAMNTRPSYPVNVYSSLLMEKPELLPEIAAKEAVKVSLSYEVKYRN